MHKIIKGGRLAEADDSIRQYDLEDDLEELSRQIKEQRRRKEIQADEPEKPPEKTVDERVEEILAKALKQSEEILNVARSEGDKIREEARQAGYEAGLEQGREAGYRQAYEENIENLDRDREEIKSQINRVIVEMKRQRERLLDKYLEDLRDIAVAVAEKVIQVSLKSSGDVIKRMIIAATDKLKKTEWAKIYISKYDAQMMAEGDAELLNALSYLSDNIKIVTMEREDSGTCIVELPKEIIDVSVGTQMENIREILNNTQL